MYLSLFPPLIGHQYFLQDETGTSCSDAGLLFGLASVKAEAGYLCHNHLICAECYQLVGEWKPGQLPYRTQQVTAKSVCFLGKGWLKAKTIDINRERRQMYIFQIQWIGLQYLSELLCIPLELKTEAIKPKELIASNPNIDWGRGKWCCTQVENDTSLCASHPRTPCKWSH